MQHDLGLDPERGRDPGEGADHGESEDQKANRNTTGLLGFVDKGRDRQGGRGSKGREAGGILGRQVGSDQSWIDRGRESRRGNLYDGIILDPPKFGRGPKGEVWEFYKLLPHLLESCSQVLSRNPQFIILTAYAVKASALTLYEAVEEITNRFNGSTRVGELVLQEKNGGRFLSRAIYAVWSQN